MPECQNKECMRASVTYSSCVIEDYKHIEKCSSLMATNNTAGIAQARKLVEQLKMEANIDRIKVSKAAADLTSYCEAHAKEDPLLSPVPASENPFREKKFFCAIL
ncbi:guanine nucleotide-binding protein G(I)/G(S)/G(O) subunit gamma-2-like isoform X1 [Carassius carassius]|uniref:guanine nucleotide-binding protein G(I)/G(S)/G(O) subunit gamma-2-like isoform X1 n=2 Tax=Carassius carassius TaxID=217509 RepID=UPI00286889F2|nr:guanine nucleotide-binding protein G(I)/G(S)/G(O) subunit gamma-2-like isoform X1 [Carassius carassius]